MFVIFSWRKIVSFSSQRCYHLFLFKTRKMKTLPLQMVCTFCAFVVWPSLQHKKIRENILKNDKKKSTQVLNTQKKNHNIYVIIMLQRI